MNTALNDHTATEPAGFLRPLQKIGARLLAPARLGKVALFAPSSVNLLILERVMNQTFREQIEDGDFDFLAAHTLGIEIIDARLFCQIGFVKGRLTPLGLSGEKWSADVELAIGVSDAISLIQQDIDPDTLFFRRKLKINGDTELAHHVKNTIDTIDPETIPAFVRNLLAGYKSMIDGA